MIVGGTVQGVGFRAACCARARSLGLGGWVRNLSDGSVEVQAEGPTHELSELQRWCGTGPPAAQVHGVSTLPLALTGEDWFEVRP
jgi:acylphosphatase